MYAKRRVFSLPLFITFGFPLSIQLDDTEIVLYVWFDIEVQRKQNIEQKLSYDPQEKINKYV